MAFGQSQRPEGFKPPVPCPCNSSVDQNEHEIDHFTVPKASHKTNPRVTGFMGAVGSLQASSARKCQIGAVLIDKRKIELL